ncbi:Mitochondrial intermediate peptidase [Babesia sp. Xinjiang]|uniref:Mitochondrial intermediate peptidase n=1 Tax=Babesia sp. Xinjiang TaxID=462227 RepID=UPI000A21893B|nr:Mitochondrial intermediate peptidase [Babesia sp. Xinjiang]ORM41109.1 Mitochondrial intermediate peptidase [Babesia sp. Xinjiang]
MSLYKLHSVRTPWNFAKCVKVGYGSSAFPEQSQPREASTSGKRLLFGLRVHNASDLVRLGDEAVTISTAVVSSVLKQSGKGKSNSRDLLYIIDHISNTLCLVADPCELLRHAHPNEAWRNAANETVEKVSAFISRINIDEKLYGIMTSAYTASQCHLNTEESLVLHHMIESMRNQGVGLPPSSQASYLEMQREEASISFELSDSSTLKHLPAAPINGRLLPPSAGMYSYVLRNSSDEDVRRLVWEAQSQSDPAALKKLLRLHHIRSSIAHIRGFRNFAECAQRECILNTPASVEAFLRKYALSIKAQLQLELSELVTLKRSHVSGKTSLRPWDLDHLMGLERDKLGVQLRVGSVLSYFERLMHDLFGIKLVRDTSEPLWHPLVAKFSLVKPAATNSDGSLASGSTTDQTISLHTTVGSNEMEMAHLYMDLFAREGKVGLCAQFTVRCSKLIKSNTADYSATGNLFTGTSGDVDIGQYTTTVYPDGSHRQVPATTIVCSFPTSSHHSDFSSALCGTYIDLSSAMTLFHELGHTVHALCSRTDLQHLSGNRGGVDFAEFSSHLFELYFLDGLKDICSIEGLDASSSAKAHLSFHKYRAIETGRMILMSLLDLKFYSSSVYMDEGCVTELYNSIDIFADEFESGTVSQLLGLPALSNFEHLVPYGGTYFCYLYSRVLAIKVWRSFEGRARSRSTGDRLYEFFAKGSTDASIAPLNVLAGRDLTSMEDELFFD